MANRGRGRRGRPRGTGQAPSAFDQQAFAEAVRIAVAAIAQACAVVNQGGSNDLQRLEVHRPPMVRGGVDSRVRTTMTTEGEVDFMRGIKDMGAGTKRKEDSSSSNTGKKQKTFVSQGYPGQGFQGFGTAQSQSAVGQERTLFVPPPPSMGQGNQYQFQGATLAPSTSQTGHIGQGQSVGRP